MLSARVGDRVLRCVDLKRTAISGGDYDPLTIDGFVAERWELGEVVARQDLPRAEGVDDDTWVLIVDRIRIMAEFDLYESW